ncbi:MAG TPA: TIGR04376 family protein [Oscillatoriales cyanobacterium M59_W2019_021]|nr:MAG: TIGR04376 family protein [Cyanobacteria bacterium J055]HIK30596.1 TIGR04376 family protein [Oscillatoriales cyanobacterium M4454_W2019_049]HIK53050.1 TIGR04376 family protein [Oscillatoriales cyanobacterium M59_W2019_021]
MGLFEDLSKFLETRLEEFLRSHPQLELQALDEQLREQEEDTLRLIGTLQLEQKQLENKILETAQDVKRWHVRIDKAKAANREDLASGAQEREAALLRQGNQLWGQMSGVKERIQKAQELQRQIQVRRQEVRAKAAQVNAERERAAQQSQQTSWETQGWNRSASTTFASSADPLEQVFQRWETDEELERMKRNL